MTGGEGQWLVVTGERGELELRDQPYTSWNAATELWVSDGTGTERLPVPAVNAYRLMVEEVSSVIRGGPGWVLPLEESRQTAAVLDAGRGREAPPCGEPVSGSRGCSGDASTADRGRRANGHRPDGRADLCKSGPPARARPEHGGCASPARPARTGSQLVKHLVPVLTLLRDAGYSDEERCAG
jgi:hypothetical protein